MSNYEHQLPKRRSGNRRIRGNRGGPRQSNQQPNEPQSGTLLRGLLSGLFGFIAFLALSFGVLLILYATIATTQLEGLSPKALNEQRSKFQSTLIFDREGNLLNEAFDPNEGKRVEVGLNRISPFLQDATIATEDANFYDHQGVDFVALLRALYYAVRERNIVSGGSTITQQLVKMTYLTPEQTLTRKVNEAILAAEITREFSKDDILEFYLNEVYYGNLAYGAAAAAETYFDKDVSELSLGEASLLAGLPQLPAVYDPYTAFDKAKRRQGVVLGLMVEAGYISETEADTAWLEPLDFEPISYDIGAPHFTLYVRQQLEEFLGPGLYTTGWNVHTTLDPTLQREAELAVREHVGSLASRRASNGALVSLDPQTGEILALVGSADFDSVEISGQINMALTPRQPGSSIKPFVYLGTFENPAVDVRERWTPGTLIPDIEEEFPDGNNPPYRPTNYDEREHGMVTVRAALANSYNIPAVRAIEEVGIPNFIQLADRLGISTLTRPDYGLSLSLGSGEIPLIEMTGAYAALANGGKRVEPIGIVQITYADGTPFCQLGTDKPCGAAAFNTGRQVLDPLDAFLITDMLSDNDARAPVFGAQSQLVLTTNDGRIRPAAAKTGTTNDIRDVLTVGYTPQLVTGVWVGNTDNSQMESLSGLSGAAPIWNRVMRAAHVGQPIRNFEPPTGATKFEVCADTGASPSPACPNLTQHYFDYNRPPLAMEQDLYKNIAIDTRTGRIATASTPRDVIEDLVFKVYPPEHQQWAVRNGIAQPPGDVTTSVDVGPELTISQPQSGESLWGVITVIGTANMPNFRSFELQYGVSHSPEAWSQPIAGPYGAPQIEGVLGQWDVTTLGNGPHTLRLVVSDTLGNAYERRLQVVVAKPTPTPQPTPTWTPPVEQRAVEQPTPTPVDTPVPATDLNPISPPTATWTPEG